MGSNFRFVDQARTIGKLRQQFVPGAPGLTLFVAVAQVHSTRPAP